MVESAAEANEELMNKYLESGRALRGGDQAGPAQAHASTTRSARCCAAPRSRTRACRRCSTRSSTTCRRRPTSRRSRASSTNGKHGERPPTDEEPFSGLAFKIMTDPFVGQLIVLPRLFGRGELGRHDLQPDQGQEGAHRPHAADARERARGDQGSARGRHRRRGRPARTTPRATRCATRTRSSRSRGWNSRSR